MRIDRIAVLSLVLMLGVSWGCSKSGPRHGSGVIDVSLVEEAIVPIPLEL